MTMELVQAGPMQAFLEEGGLRYVTWNGVEIVRGVYAAVRDRDWGTVPPQLGKASRQVDEEGTTIDFTCVHCRDEIDFVWQGSIRISSNGIRFQFDGLARSSFLRNRVGLCVLHPMEFAGLKVEVRTEDGGAHGEFPHEVSPWQPFSNMTGMTYEPAPGIKADLVFHGDLFEMEDQRNWTDASYKTYCTPLGLPFPVRVEEGQRISQSVDIRIDGTGFALAAENAGEPSPERIEVSSAPIGVLPDIGFALATTMPDARETERLSVLQPSCLRVVADQTRDGWTQRLHEAADVADALGCGLEIELIAGDGERLRELSQWIETRRMSVLRLLPFRPGAFVTDGETLAAVRRALNRQQGTIAVGGGTRAYYAELNRAQLPLGELDFVSYSINPQVHAFDDASLMETLSAQRVTAADAIGKTGKPLYIGPVTFKPRLNPNATSGAAISIEDQHDVRQDAMFGAAWTLGSIATLSSEAVRGVVYYETSGPLGIVGPHASPIYYVFKDVMACRGAEVLEVRHSPGRVAALALRLGGRTRLALANLTDAAATLSIGGVQGMASSLRILDHTTLEDLRSDPSAAIPSRSMEWEGTRVKLSLAPYAYACLDFELQERP